VLPISYNGVIMVLLREKCCKGVLHTVFKGVRGCYKGVTHTICESVVGLITIPRRLRRTTKGC
jgi:hypothetical protein